MESIEQAVYAKLLEDNKLRCTCDDMIRENTFFQAQGHYHHCMLYQVTRAIVVTLKLEKDREAGF